MTNPPFPARRKRRSLKGRFLLLLALLAVTSLACISTEIVIKLVPQQGEEGEVTVTLAQHLTEAYLEAASQANVEWAQDYAAAGMDVPENLFPETWQEMGDEPMEAPEGFEIIQQDERGYVAVGTSSFAELEDPESSAEWSLSVNRDDPERVRYLLEIEMPEVDPGFDLNEMDRLRAEGLGPKPPVNTADSEPTESIGVAGLLESLGDAMSETAEENSLDGWYAQRVLVESGVPTIAYVVELPGEIVRHELDGQPAGVLDADAGRVTLVVDEAYMKKYGPGEYVFQVESVDQTEKTPVATETVSDLVRDLESFLAGEGGMGRPGSRQRSEGPRYPFC